MDARRILVVDDDDCVRSLLRDILECEGFHVQTATDGAQAIAALQTALPDCVLLDVMMPGLDGLAVLEYVRASEAGTSLPVVMVTALTDDQSQWRAWKGGADYLLSKPLDSGLLVDYLHALLTATPDERAGSFAS